MTESEKYFQEYEGYFWKWEEESNVIALCDAGTIAYKAFITKVIASLVEGGLPRFGAVLMVLTATNKDGDALVRKIRKLIEQQLPTIVNTSNLLNEVVTFLRLLSSLPPQYKEGKRRLLVLQTLFADCHQRLSLQDSKAIYDTLLESEIISAPELLRPAVPFDYRVYYEDFRVLQLISRKFPDIQTLINKIADFPVVDEELLLEKEQDGNKGTKDFIDELVDNVATFPAGALVRRLWSGLNIPHHNHASGTQPIGGVSDLTNKGEFHRLLISEFANDDVVLLSRLANNEALYFNREMPPQHHNTERVILIDNSIRNWGTPKAIAYALLVAIARHPKTDIPCSAYLVGDTYTPIGFNTVDEVIDGLQQLSPALHCGAGLEMFFQENTVRKNLQVFFISTRNAYRHAAMHKVISDNFSSFHYWLYTDADGSIDVYKRQQASKRHVQHLQLSLSELWRNEPRARNTQEQNRGATSYPILFPVARKVRQLMRSNTGETYVITTQFNLVRIIDTPENEVKGWEMIYENLPKFSTAAIGVDDMEGLWLLLYNRQNSRITIIDVGSNKSWSMDFHTQWFLKERGYQFAFYENRFIYFNPNVDAQWWAFSMTDVILVNPETRRIRDEVKIFPGTDEHFSIKESQHAGNIFKNFTQVHINQVGNLVFRDFELILNDLGEISIIKTGFLQPVVSAKYEGKHDFRFPDGSLVTRHPSGLLTLKSSDTRIPDIFIPCVVQKKLAAATTEDFAGNEHYLPVQHGPKKVISAARFFNKYLIPFIETIKSHAT